MAYEFRGAGAPEGQPCRYGGSRLPVRGPRRQLSGPFIAALGGAETYGCHVARPWPALAESALGLPVVNLGCPHAGPEALLHDGVLPALAAQARACVVQITGAAQVSSRFYRVHPRRNDRFVGETAALRRLYPSVDFTEFAFTGHLLAGLQARNPGRFATVATAQRAAWLARMTELVAALGGPVVLLWMGDRLPPPAGQGSLGPGVPSLIDAGVIETIAPRVAAVVQVVPSAGALAAGTEGMRFAPMDAPAAAALPNPRIHAETAGAVAAVLRRTGLLA